MVGMPYPNIKSPELQEKISYLDKHLVRPFSVILVFTVSMNLAKQEQGHKSTGMKLIVWVCFLFFLSLRVEGGALAKH